ncbi:uncharacterized protein Z518_07191 [Rhinocladiella mackenziei CBS 650.93]|uniref:Sacsin/Nov domain-containing protein n=1 Tax=Rhinocladiella mackenziei CBS 650.93 TaxID=1442369 RepID=A0A0D2GZL7_9EURO|nr:uncharacterized protein Z518_07191 [Rhinocladiella mackenziei CBS 650.93]KIX03638.1 hypothetical protein Z518_07191 [Rhinocladiella mackenziei CBS 650.93]
MIDPELSEFYEKLYDSPLTEPKDEQDVKNILTCIRAGHGDLDDEDDDQLRKAGSEIFRKKITMMASKSRKVLAQFTKMISNQLYDDPFRFFYELLQNADDARYLRCGDTPTISFTVSQTELIVDLNEDGFSLSDVLAICSIGESSKTLDQNSTGEKGFGFKSVFGVADQVHITSGVWSFRFKHQREEDGIGMIQPYWEPGEQLPENVRTRFRLQLSFSEKDGLETLCAQMRSLHPSIIFALRQIKKLSVRFEIAEAGNGTVSFEKSVDVDRNIMTIVSREDAKATEYFYRVLDGQASDMPRNVERTQTTSNVTIGLPISAPNDGSPLLDEAGQFVFAFLPIVQIKELPFLVHADFILTGSRQAISDNAWNKALRNKIAALFCTLAKRLALEKSKLSYEWLAYIPLQPMVGFLQPLSASIRQILREQELFFSMNGSLHKPSRLRILTSDFTHQSEALMSDSKQAWCFLSKKYKSSDHPALIDLGTSRLSFDDAFDLIEDDLQSNDSRLRSRPLHDAWHDTFTTFIKKGLALGNVGYRKRIHNMPIIPVRVDEALEWYRPGPNIFFPHAVNEGTGPECILIEMPTDIDLVVLQPDAATAPKRREVYLTLGVQQASSAKICTAITKAMTKSGTRYVSDLLRSLELLFWFSYKPLTLRDELKASTSGGIYQPTNQLFMRSREQYHAECLVRLDENPDYGKHFLNKIYQSSKVATRSRGGKTWEQWLVEVAGVRWYPPLQDLSSREKLHWILDVVHGRDSILFLSVIQTYWAQEYSSTCRFNPKLDEVLRECQVLCKHGGTEELSKSWFPTQNILSVARKYGVEKRLPILSLPDPPQEHLISDWPALRDLGIRYTVDLWFYRQAISLLSETGQRPTIGSVKLGCLYKNMADRVTLEDRKTIQDDFKNRPLIWDPTSNVWRTIDRCVWESHIALHRRFVIISAYEKATVSGLFETHLQVPSVSVECLIEELEYLRDSRGPETNAELQTTVSKVYNHLADMNSTVEQKQTIRCSFQEKNLIYNPRSNDWLQSKSCVWHSTMDISNHVPIAATYSELQEFFIGVLGVQTVTPMFMMKQLAAAAKSNAKTVDNIKKLMLAASELLDMGSNGSQFRSSMEVLDECAYLPCRSIAGATEFRSKSQSFFIVDNETYANEFGDQLVMLDFTYEQVNSLHKLIRLLGLDDHYLARHVLLETSARVSTPSDTLMAQFHECAYPISCCAISHRSALFSNQSRLLYDALANAIIHTSSEMFTYLVVTQDEHPVKVPTSRPSLIPKYEHNRLEITLPAEERATRQCMRSQLPGYIAAELLNIFDSRAEKQIYRILNELETGTDDILFEEGISRVSWLPETRRPAPTPPLIAPQTSDLADDEPNLPTDPIQTNYRQPYRALPVEIQHEIDAPDYWKVIEHVHKQASKIGNRLHRRNYEAGNFDDLAAEFAGLVLDHTVLDPNDCPNLFGNDVWLSKFRLGAAGELFVYEVLKHMLGDEFGLPNWQSNIRYLVQAHESYRHVTRWSEPETADIVFYDQDKNLEFQFSHSWNTVSDVFQDWYPPPKTPLEWLFEVKTTLGPCETEFYMSPNQYNTMRELGTQEDSERNRVYCIVRVYNLLSDKIGVRIYIDPWRFREGRLEFGTTEKWKVKPVD